jgi:glycosyltransferase involved in cell wall biosynthesis
MKLPTISVIIPTLNEEKYIESSLKSLINQDYKGEYEIIVADGMSKDNTVRIAKKFADKVITVKQRGVSAGRNEGAKIAKGEILLFLDADTILLFNGLTEISKPFRKKKVAGVACPIIPLSPEAKDFAIYWSLNQFIKKSLKTNKPQVTGICCAYRKKVFEKVGGFNKYLDTLEDYDLSERISKKGEIVFIQNTLALTSNRRIKKWGRMKSIRKYLQLYFNYILRKKTFDRNEYEPVR